MKLEKDYLSEEELEALIADIEENDLVLAPKDLLTNILRTIDEEAQNMDLERCAEKENDPASVSFKVQNNRVIEFRKYCIQVITSVAATIALVFLLPTSMQVQKAEIPSKDMIIAEQTVKTKADVLEHKKLAKLEDFLNDIRVHIFK